MNLEHSLTLSSPRLRVEVARPSAVPGSRWDRSGFITQVTLDNLHTFCGQEGGGNLGQGLCSEFGIATPIGYGEAAPGERFPKLGIGLVQRLDDGPYSFSKNADVEMFPLQIEELVEESRGNSQSVRFGFEPLECRGFAARLEKTLRVEENRLRIEYRLENVGQKPLQTEEYNHNFLSLNGRETRAGYLLRSSLPLRDLSIETDAERATVEFQSDLENDLDEAHGIRWRGTPRTAFYAAMDLPQPQKPQSEAPIGAWWELRHDETGTRVRESVSFVPSRLALYCTARAICPEVFIAIDVAPGQAQSWTRQWTFEAR